MEPTKRGPANLLRGRENVGGTLELVGRHLRFEPHGANAQRGAVRIEVSDIKRLRPAWTKAFGLVPLVPNAMDVTMRNDERFHFSVSGRKAWIAAIEQSHADTPRN